ncbi:hypothetical protein [Petrachloros mirabilis]
MLMPWQLSMQQHKVWRAMSLDSFKMMMSSGVLRPGSLEIRRMSESASHVPIGKLPELLNNLLDVPFRNKTEHKHEMNTQELKRNRADRNSFPSARPRRSLLGRMLGWFGIHRPNGKGPQQEFPHPYNIVARLEERVALLESLLQVEQNRCLAQADELAKLRAQMKRIEQLQAELNVEQVSGRMLVQWLQDAEQQLADAHGVRISPKADPIGKGS